MSTTSAAPVYIRAGNIAHIDRTFTRIGSGSVAGSTANVAITDAGGTTTALTGEVVTIDNTAGTVRVEADWNIADAAVEGFYTVTVDVGTAMVAAWQGSIYVMARTLPVVP